GAPRRTGGRGRRACAARSQEPASAGAGPATVRPHVKGLARLAARGVGGAPPLRRRAGRGPGGGGVGAPPAPDPPRPWPDNRALPVGRRDGLDPRRRPDPAGDGGADRSGARHLHRFGAQGVLDMTRTGRPIWPAIPAGFVRAVLAGHSSLGLAFAALIFLV